MGTDSKRVIVLGQRTLNIGSNDVYAYTCRSKRQAADKNSNGPAW